MAEREDDGIIKRREEGRMIVGGKQGREIEEGGKDGWGRGCG